MPQVLMVGWWYTAKLPVHVCGEHIVEILITTHQILMVVKQEENVVKLKFKKTSLVEQTNMGR